MQVPRPATTAAVFGALTALAPATARPEGPALPIVTAAPAFEWYVRRFRHTEYSPPDERRYDANGFPVAALAVQAYPAATTRARFWQDVGLTIDYARSLGFTSQSARAGAAYNPPVYVPIDTTFVRYGMGIRYRLPLGDRTADPIVLGASLGYGAYRFEFDRTVLVPATDLEVPTADYDLFRIGADVRAPVGPVAFSGGVTYAHAFSVGSLGNRTPAGGANGVEMEIGIEVRLLRPLWLRASAKYAVLAFNLLPLAGREGDRQGHVVDSYVAFGIGPVVSF